MLTMGEQKKIIPMEREPTQAAGDTERTEWVKGQCHEAWLTVMSHSKHTNKPSPGRLHNNAWCVCAWIQELPCWTHTHTVLWICSSCCEFPFWVVFINLTVPCLYLHPLSQPGGCFVFYLDRQQQEHILSEQEGVTRNTLQHKCMIYTLSSILQRFISTGLISLPQSIQKPLKSSWQQEHTQLVQSGQYGQNLVKCICI